MSSIAPPRPPVNPRADDGPCLVSSLVAISKSMRVMLGLKLAEIGVIPGQDDLLLTLQPSVTLPVTLLADAINVRASTVSKMADRLVASGLVERVSTERDGRRIFLRLTAKGYRVREEIQIIRSELAAEIEAEAIASGMTITAADLEGLDRVVRKRLQRLR